LPESPSPIIQRRRFLATAGAATFACAAQGLFSQKSLEAFLDPSQQISRQELSALLDKVLIPSSPQLHNFAMEVYAACILGKIERPTPPFRYPWMVPGGGYFGQWLWDTMFVVDLLAVLPGKEELIRGIFQNYWDFQQRWDAAMPVYRHGMIANFIAPYDSPGSRDGKQWRTFPAYSQIPILAWGMERVYLRNGDLELLRAGLASLEKFHEWYWRERDILGMGLVGVGAYSGVTQEARYETYDMEIDLDGLKMISHPGRTAGANNGAWYGDIAIPSNTAYLVRSEQSLERMATILGDHAMAARRRARHDKGSAAMSQHMWDENAGCYLAVHTDNLQKIGTPSVGSFMPLMAQVPAKKQAATMVATLASPAWATPVPIPSVPFTSPEFSSGKYWRGDSWPAANYQVATGLASYGLRAAAARLADVTVENILQHGIFERYDSLSGAGLGVAGNGMTAAAVTMLLDGLTSDKYVLRVRKDGRLRQRLDDDRPADLPMRR
jgi:putative isomerase